MKNAVKLFGFAMCSVVLFSCSTDEQDADLERAITLSKTIEQAQAKVGETATDSIAIGQIQYTTSAQVDGNPLIIVKRD